jgi:hypothetical protein
VAAVTLDPERTLSWERRHRPRAAIAALLGALGLLVFYVASQRLQSQGPSTSGLDSLERIGQGGADIGKEPSLRLAEFQFLHDNTPLVLAIGIGAFIGFTGMAWGVGFLAVATRARMPEFRRWLIFVPIVGGVVVGIAILLIQVAVVLVTNDFLDSARTVADATRPRTGVQQFGQILYTLGSLLLAVGMVITALNAMRSGLLTKLFGYIGIVAGALLVLVPLPVVQIFWLGGVGILLLGRWPGGDLPAWRTGRSEPWPSAVQVAAERAERAGKAVPKQAAQPAKPAGGASGRGKRKKRQ